MDTERQLVERAMRGEPGAFDLLYQRHVEAVFNYVLFRVRDVTVAEDLTQDVFMNAYKNIAQLRRQDRFGHWLLRIAHNRVLNHWRAQSARPRITELDREGEASSTLEAAAMTADAFQALEARLSAEDVLGATRRLTDLQRQVIALRFVAGLSVAETATAMDRSIGAVKNLQHHALAALRQQLCQREVTS